MPQAHLVPQIRSQVGISQQQRLSNSMALANARLSPSQVMQAQAVQARALAQAQAQVQAAGNMSIAQPAMNSAHLSPPYAPRATSSSPGIPQQSPPLPSAPPTSGTGLSRPPSAQQHSGMTTASQNVPVNSMPRPATNMSYYHVQGVHGAQFTPEQVEQAIRLQQSMMRVCRICDSE